MKSIEEIINWEWYISEYWDDALCRGAVVSALKLNLWRKYPYLGKNILLRFITGSWYELTAFISYERGRFFSIYLKKALIQLNASKIFTEKKL